MTMIQPDLINKASKLLGLLSEARELRTHLVTHPSHGLQLWAIEPRDDSLYDEVTIKDDALRVVVIDFLIDSLKHQLLELGVDV